MFTLSQIHAHFGRETHPDYIASDFFNSCDRIRRLWMQYVHTGYSLEQILALAQLSPEIGLETLGIALSMEGEHIDPLLAFIMDAGNGIYAGDQPGDGFIGFVRNGVIKSREYGFKLLKQPYSLLTESDDYAHLVDPEQRLPAQEKLKEHLRHYAAPQLYVEDNDGGWHCRNLRLYLAIFPDKLVKAQIQVGKLILNADRHFAGELAEQAPLPEAFMTILSEGLRHYDYHTAMPIRQKVFGHQVMSIVECRERLDDALDAFHCEEFRSKRATILQLIEEMVFPKRFEELAIQKVVDDYFKDWLENRRVGDARPGTFEYQVLFEALRLKGYKAHYLGLTLSHSMKIFEVWELEATGVSLLPRLVSQLGDRQIQFVSNALGCAILQYPQQDILANHPNDKALRNLYGWTKDETFLNALSPEGLAIQLENDLGL